MAAPAIYCAFGRCFESYLVCLEAVLLRDVMQMMISKTRRQLENSMLKAGQEKIVWVDKVTWTSVVCSRFWQSSALCAQCNIYQPLGPPEDAQLVWRDDEGKSLSRYVTHISFSDQTSRLCCEEMRNLHGPSDTRVGWKRAFSGGNEQENCVFVLAGVINFHHQLNSIQQITMATRLSYIKTRNLK
jgi:hypothetical protein